VACSWMSLHAAKKSSIWRSIMIERPMVRINWEPLLPFSSSSL
jgi:hypothetical protein